MNLSMVAANTLIGSAIFSSLGSSPESEALRYIAGILSCFVAILSAVKMQLNYDGRAEAHHNAQRSWSRVKRKMEVLFEVRGLPLVDNQGSMHKEWQLAVSEWEQLEADSPHVSDKYIHDARAILYSNSKARARAPSRKKNAGPHRLINRLSGYAPSGGALSSGPASAAASCAASELPSRLVSPRQKEGQEPAYCAYATHCVARPALIRRSSAPDATYSSRCNDPPTASDLGGTGRGRRAPSPMHPPTDLGPLQDLLSSRIIVELSEPTNSDSCRLCEV